MEQPNNPDMESLLPRYCDGKVTDEERRQVEEWLDASEENRRVARQIDLIYSAAHAIRIQRDIDTEKALDKARGKMIVRRRKWQGWEWMQRAAAVLFLPLLITTLLLQFADGTDSGELAVAQRMEVKTAPGMTTSVVLPDGTKVYLNSESTLTYPVRFEGDAREVSLSGEAYFEVEKMPQKRFIVSTSHRSQIEVLGTHFNVEAYADEPDVTTTLVEGKVNFLFGEGQARKRVSLEPRQKLVYCSGKNDISLQATSCLAETAWKDGKIIFDNTPLRQGLRLLEKRYNVEFVIRNDRGLDDPFTGTFTNQRIERILQYFQISSKIRWRYIDSPDIADEKSRIEIY